MKSVGINALNLIHRLQGENERLTEVRNDFRQEVITLNNEKRELQKQVDELTQRYLEESKERCKFEQLYDRKCHDKNIGIGVQRAYWEKKVQQTVKDTAKEILQELYDQIDENTPKWVGVQIKIIAKRKGVEVE